jgi:hypothetical protein
VAALVAAPAAQIVGLLAFEQLLDHQPGDRVDQSRDDVRPLVDTASQQAVEILADEHGWRYSPHWPEPPCLVFERTATWKLRSVRFKGP